MAARPTIDDAIAPITAVTLATCLGIPIGGSMPKGWLIAPDQMAQRRWRLRQPSVVPGCQPGSPARTPPTASPGKRTCNVGNFLRTLTKPEPIENWPLTNLKEKLVKIGVKLVIHDCHTTLHIASRRRSMQSTRLVRALADLPRSAERQIIDTRKPVTRRILIKSTRLRENCNGKPSSNSGGGNFRLWVIIRCRCRISAERPSRV